MGIAFYSPSAHYGIDEYTVLMLHGDEDPLIDSSDYQHELNLAGGMARTDSTSVFGDYSMSFNGSNTRYVSIVNPPAEFDWGTQDMTIDFWVSKSTANIWMFYGGCTNWGLWHADSTWTIAGSPGGALYWSAGVDLPGYDEVIWSNSNFRGLSGWHHVALVKSGSLHMMFIDGIKQNRTVDIGANVPGFGSHDFFVGRHAGTSPDALNGTMDEFRLSVGIARWTENFTPPTIAYY